MELRPQDRIALDRAESTRTIDIDGHMHVVGSNISKANVCPYRGDEIPGYDKLGLVADQVYQLYRDPIELAKAAPTFNGKPLLIIHRPLSADDHLPEVVVGSLNNVKFESPYLRADLSIWDGDAISVINSGEQKELSCGYRYVPVMESGIAPDGTKFQARMTEIQGNHCALVTVGRAGSDVMVGDSAMTTPIEDTPIPEDIPAPTPETAPVFSPYHLKENLMAKSAVFSRTALQASGALNAYLLPKITADQKVDLGPILKDVTAKNWGASKPKIKLALDTALEGKLVPDADISDIVDMLGVAVDASPDDDDDDEEDKKKKAKEAAEKLKEAAAEDEDDDTAKDEEKDDDDDDKKKKPAFLKDKGAKDMSAKDTELSSGEVPRVSRSAMDAAIKAAVTKAKIETETSTIARLRAIAEAERAVRPYIGELAFSLDSAEEVYRLALDHAGIDLEGVPPAAFSAMVKMLSKPGDIAPAVKQKQAFDSALMDTMAKRFPGVTALKQR